MTTVRDSLVASKRHLQKKWRWALPLLAGSVLVGAAGFYTASRRATTDPDLSELTVPAQTQDLTVRVEASGSVVPISTVNVSPKTSGRLAALYVDQGERVKAGQIVARMDSESLKARLAQTKAQLTQAEADYKKVRAGSRIEEIGRAKAQVAAAQAQAELNRQRAERYRSLARAGAIAQDQLDEVLSGDRSARANLREAQQQLQELSMGSRSEDIESAAARVKAARAQVALVQAQLDDTIIRVPFDGIVTQKYATVGAIVTPTTSASTTVSATSTSIVALASELELKVNVPETDIAQVKNDQRVEIMADAYPPANHQKRSCAWVSALVAACTSGLATPATYGIEETGC